jgi:selenide, water dikinase
VAKLAPRDLAQVLSKLPPQTADNVLVGFDHADDAGVVRLSDDLALVQTVDFFTPVADDPEMYGRIAAINALNDVYAMGGRPISALSIICYPQSGDWDVLGEIMLGGQRAMQEHEVPVVGGHSVDDKEIKVGYAVTGVIDPRRILTNAGAVAGDTLVLTKPLGTGAINTAVKRGKASRETEAAALACMSTSNRDAAAAALELDAHGCTDVTGFGLLGHAFEMAQASGVTLEIDSTSVPFLPDVLELISMGMLTRGDKNNRAYVGDDLDLSSSVDAPMQSALFDPQTAGGLLVSLAPDNAQRLVGRIPGSAIIGRVMPQGQHFIAVV